jgi:hypothetical protein
VASSWARSQAWSDRVAELARSRLAQARAGAGQEADRAHLTVRGAAVGMFALFFLGALVAAWLHADVLTGLTFCAGAIVAVRLVRCELLPIVVMMPPAIFVLAVGLVQIFTVQGKTLHAMVLSVLEGSLIALAGSALWLFGGMAVCITLAVRRGLLPSISDLRAALRAARR